MRSIGFGCLVAIFLMACATTSGTNTPRRSSNVITAEELASSRAKEALEAIELLRPQWLRVRGVASPGSAQLLVPSVYVNNQRLPELASLRNYPANNIEEIRYMSAQDATTLYGTGNVGGAIVVKTK
ncbi:MAG: Plug domain-containing protein [candidate division KSB1 bacterium]|nr:Plug domain-containing protein [candidate division KSB1 bacterium]MDZ7367100.1 Plug domain-containing protein [candidate division KSB1 bacterium]MDZ7405078.1 Plug domain-containing protein [candidate division KSB1 bacterium]